MSKSAMRAMLKKSAVLLVLSAGVFAGQVSLAAESPAGGDNAPSGTHGEEGVNWQGWKANNEITNQSSLQRGAAHFMNYCQSCHSLKYMRYSRMGTDLGISDELLRTQLLPPNVKATDYITSTFPQAEGEAWFGRAPPDLSLITRAKGVDYVYKFLKGFYLDETRTIGTNNLMLPGAAMPAVLSDLEGVKRAVMHEAGTAGSHGGGPAVERFEMVAPGELSPQEFDTFVRDTANFLSYVGEPSQAKRVHLGIWVVLFLLVFTWFTYLLKVEYWKDVH